MELAALPLHLQGHGLPPQELVQHLGAAAPQGRTEAPTDGQAELSGAKASGGRYAAQLGLAQAQGRIAGAKADPNHALVGEFTAGGRQHIGGGVGAGQIRGFYPRPEFQGRAHPEAAIPLLFAELLGGAGPEGHGGGGFGNVGCS